MKKTLVLAALISPFLGWSQHQKLVESGTPQNVSKGTFSSYHTGSFGPTFEPIVGFGQNNEAQIDWLNEPLIEKISSCPDIKYFKTGSSVEFSPRVVLSGTQIGGSFTIGDTKLRDGINDCNGTANRNIFHSFHSEHISIPCLEYGVNGMLGKQGYDFEVMDAYQDPSNATTNYFVAQAKDCNGFSRIAVGTSKSSGFTDGKILEIKSFSNPLAIWTLKPTAITKWKGALYVGGKDLGSGYSFIVKLDLTTYAVLDFKYLFVGTGSSIWDLEGNDNYLLAVGHKKKPSAYQKGFVVTFDNNMDFVGELSIEWDYDVQVNSIVKTCSNGAFALSGVVEFQNNGDRDPWVGHIYVQKNGFAYPRIVSECGSTTAVSYSFPGNDVNRNISFATEYYFGVQENRLLIVSENSNSSVTAASLVSTDMSLVGNCDAPLDLVYTLSTDDPLFDPYESHEDHDYIDLDVLSGFDYLGALIGTVEGCNQLQAPGSESTTGLNATSANDIIGVSVYPNPTKNHLNISSENTLERVELFNSAGEMVNSMELGSMNANINTSHLPVGSYFIKVIQKDQSSTHHFIIQD